MYLVAGQLHTHYIHAHTLSDDAVFSSTMLHQSADRLSVPEKGVCPVSRDGTLTVIQSARNKSTTTTRRGSPLSVGVTMVKDTYKHTYIAL